MARILAIVWLSYNYNSPMPTFSVAEAKNNLSKLIDLALKGEQVTITRHGRAVIDLKPNRSLPQSRRSPQEDIEWLRARRVTPIKPLDEDSGALVSRMRDEEWEGR